MLILQFPVYRQFIAVSLFHVFVFVLKVFVINKDSSRQLFCACAVSLLNFTLLHILKRQEKVIHVGN